MDSTSTNEDSKPVREEKLLKFSEFIFNLNETQKLKLTCQTLEGVSLLQVCAQCGFFKG